ncbi:MAG: hypothetical protein RBU27_11055 [Bacteroidota bacterium]|nr:hypothetical protein [Bacteroidota bacterium]
MLILLLYAATVHAQNDSIAASSAGETLRPPAEAPPGVRLGANHAAKVAVHGELGLTLGVHF